VLRIQMILQLHVTFKVLEGLYFAETIRKPLNFVVLDARTEQTLRLSWPHRLKVRESFKIIGTCAQVPSYYADEPI
jgi:hypothetical protein